jgi:hypothetical protein
MKALPSGRLACYGLVHAIGPQDAVINCLETIQDVGRALPDALRPRPGRRLVGAFRPFMTFGTRAASAYSAITMKTRSPCCRPGVPRPMQVYGPIGNAGDVTSSGPILVASCKMSATMLSAAGPSTPNREFLGSRNGGMRSCYSGANNRLLKAK